MTWILIGVVCVLLAACRKEEISVTKVTKSPEASIPMAPSSDVAHSAPSIGQIKYTVPAGWHEEAPAGMSQASFSITGKNAGVSAMAFPGAAASQLSLINIVRENAGLSDLSDAEMAKLSEPVTIGGEQGSLIDFTGATKSGTNVSKGSISLAVLTHAGATWFFKLSGDSEVVTAEKPVLMEFLKSVKFVEGSPAAVGAQASGMPAGHPSVSGMPQMGGNTPAAPVAAGNKPTWEIPATWKEVPPTQMLMSKFTLGDDSSAATVTVSVFPGDVGGLLANVNRWRGMVGLEPIQAPELEKSAQPLDLAAGKARLVDVSGKSNQTGKDSRLVGVIFPRNGQTWFYKLMGDTQVVTKENDAFIKFVQSAKYPND